MPPVVAALPAIGGFLASNASWLAPVAMGAASMGLSALQAGQQREASKEAMQTWEQAAYPSASAVQAYGTQARGQLGQSRLGAQQNLYSQLAARGFGPGSGLMGQGLMDINRAYLQALGKLGTDITQYAATPMFGPPSSAYPSTTPLGAALGSGSSALNQGMGYYMMKQMLPSGGGNYIIPSTTAPATTNPFGSRGTFSNFLIPPTSDRFTFTGLPWS